MKKRNVLLTAVIAVSLALAAAGCGSKDSTKAGVAADRSELYDLVPESATGLVTINFSKMASLPAFDKMKDNMKMGDLAKNQDFFRDYEDFVNKTGIDPKKDIRTVVMAVYGEIDEKEPDVSVIAKLNYDKGKLLGLLKQSGKDFSVSNYQGLELYSGKDEKGKDSGFIFLSDDVITAGSIPGIQKVADLAKKGGKSILSNSKMKALMEKTAGSSIVSFVFNFPEKLKGMKGNGMIQADLSKAEALYGMVDFVSNNWLGELILVSRNEEGNSKLAATLNGLKGLGAMGGPEVAELLNNINISATADSIRLKFKISSELLEKLKSKAEDKSGMFGQ